MRENRSFGKRSKTKDSDEVKRKCLMVFEGEATEPLYFAKVRDLKEKIGISSLIQFIQIEKSDEKSWSNPKKIVDTLCSDLSGKLTYGSLINAMIDSLYEDDYLVRHLDKISEFKELLLSFIHNDLHVSEDDSVNDIDATVRKTLDFFKEKKPAICNIIISHFYDMLKAYDITFDKEIDFLCLVVDRDPDSFTEWQFDDVLKTCEKNGFRFLISNPNFEFWLLLHFDAVLNLDREKMLKNEKINKSSKSSIRFLPNELRKNLGHYKKNKYDAEYLVLHIDTAIKNEKNFCEKLPGLKTDLGCNIGEFIDQLRKL